MTQPRSQPQRLHRRLPMLSFICGLFLSGALCAAPDKLMDREQAAQHVQQHYDGKILDLKPIKTGNGQAYRVKLLQPSGRVKLMLIDAHDGKPRPFDSPSSKD
ncbi:MAG: PepSY domain-containing protein [Halopseudomonas sp.]